MKQASAVRTTILATVFAGLVLAVAVLDLVGHGLDLTVLVRVRTGWQAMSIFTALGVLVLGLSALAATRSQIQQARILAAVGLCMGLMVLMSFALAHSDVINPMIARLVGLDPAGTGRTSPATALGLTLLGASGLARLNGWTKRADALAGFCLLVAGVALLGYLYGVSALYALAVFRSMALNTASALLLLALADLLRDPSQGWARIVSSPNNGAVRRQLSFGVVPVLAGGLLLHALQRQQIGVAAALALLVTLTMVPLGLLILRDGRRQDILVAEQQARQRLTEDANSRLEASLALKVEELAIEAAERRKADEALGRASRMESIGQLTGGIAHDFNNLLMAVDGNLQLLARRLDPDHAGRRYLDNALAALENGAKLTGQLLSFSRMQKLDIGPVELAPALASAIRLIGASLGPEITVQAAIAPDVGWVSTDRVQLELALLNLALNARDAMPDGGVLRIDVARDEAEAMVAITVTDTGQGMEPEVLARAVEPFFTTKPQGKGTGLGLSQIYGFVRQSLGELDIRSQPGDGATIRIKLPSMAAPLAVDVTTNRSIAEVPRQASTLLVIDDDPFVRDVVFDALSAAGYHVVAAEDGPSGLARLDHITPAAAIIDFIMPGMNGAEVARRVHERLPGLPIVFISGYADTDALRGVAGAVILRKPFAVVDLQSMVAGVLH